MNIITSRAVYRGKQLVKPQSENTSNAAGDVAFGPAPKPSTPLLGLGGSGYTPPSTPSTGGGNNAKQVGEKLKGAIQFGKDSGIFDLAKQAAANRQARKQGGLPPVSNVPDPIEDKKGLSTGAKIGIGVGVLVVVGLIIYAVKSK